MVVSSILNSLKQAPWFVAAWGFIEIDAAAKEGLTDSDNKRGE